MAFRTALALLLITFSIPLGAEPTARSSSAAPVAVGPEIVGLDSDSVRFTEVEDVLAAFDDAGLELPQVMIEFYQTTESCHGHDGLIRYVGTIPVIAICSARPYVLPHEMAHAWVDANVSEQDKAAYVATWGLNSWNDKSDDWNDRGTEHAAFVIQQNLTASPHRLTETWQDRADAFEMLTGLPSPLRPSSEVSPS